MRPRAASAPDARASAMPRWLRWVTIRRKACVAASARKVSAVPSRGPGRSLPGGPRRWRGSQPLAHAGREDAQLVAVLRHGPPRDLDALLREHLHDLLVGEGVLRVFIGHHLLNLRADVART